MSKSERKPSDVNSKGQVTGGGGSAKKLDELVKDGQPSPSPSPTPREKNDKADSKGDGGGGGAKGETSGRHDRN